MFKYGKMQQWNITTTVQILYRDMHTRTVILDLFVVRINLYPSQKMLRLIDDVYNYIENNRVIFVFRLFHMNKMSSWNKIHLAHFCSFNMLEKLKDRKVENSKLVNNWNIIFYHLYARDFPCQIISFGFRFFGMVMII